MWHEWIVIYGHGPTGGARIYGWHWPPGVARTYVIMGGIGPPVWNGRISFMLQGPTGVARMYSNIWSWADRCGTDIYHYGWHGPTGAARTYIIMGGMGPPVWNGHISFMFQGPTGVAQMNSNIWSWADRCGTDIYHHGWHGPTGAARTYIIMGDMGPPVRHGHISFMLQGPTGVARMYSHIWSWAHRCGTDISL